MGFCDNGLAGVEEFSFQAVANITWACCDLVIAMYAHRRGPVGQSMVVAVAMWLGTLYACRT